MCLERCNGTTETIDANLKQIQQHLDVMTSVSFECYNLGPNSTLVQNNLTVVSPQLQQMGLETWPMVSSYPYPPQFLEWMRQVFANPQPFVDQCIQEGLKWNYTGFNIDWEPTTDASAQDAIDYANFLTYLTNNLHKKGLKVSF